MTTTRQALLAALKKIDRPGSYCTSGSLPGVLPGLEVAGMGSVGLPLNAVQAEELKKHCEQAPYGKGEQTLVDTDVRRVWRLTPEHFSLKNPGWDGLVGQIVEKVQEALGLEKQKLESHLYDLLLYEPGSFFLPHKDGEKLDRMVATLVVVLPSSFEGGELIVRHDGREQTIDQGGEKEAFNVRYAAFYADCEHEIRPLRKGYRLCLVYNLTLKKGKKGVSAPRASEHVEAIRPILAEWAEQEDAEKLAITLDHQYTQEGLAWDALKGVDRARADVLREAAGMAGCQIHLALLTYHESGQGEEDDYGYRGGGRWDDEDEEDEKGEYEMVEVYESDLTADHWRDSQDSRLELGELGVDEEELLDPEALKKVKPEEEFEGYTGNAGMTLDRWYRHGAIFLWPERKHFEILCTIGSGDRVDVLERMVKGWRESARADKAARKATCLAFARTTVQEWKRAWGGYGGFEDDKACKLLPSLERLDDVELIRAYLRNVVAKDPSVKPGKPLVTICKKHGWPTFRKELESVFRETTVDSIDRNLHLLARLCSAKASGEVGWAELVESLATAWLADLERIDKTPRTGHYDPRASIRNQMLGVMTRALLDGEQFALLDRAVSHVLAHPAIYPLTMQTEVLIALRPWLAEHLSAPCPPLSRWIGACCQQYEGLTAQMPQPPGDQRRPDELTCNCKDCAELKQFLQDPRERERRFARNVQYRRHLEEVIKRSKSDLDCTTDRNSKPQALVCTKNDASYRAALKKYQQDKEQLGTLRAIEPNLPK